MFLHFSPRTIALFKVTMVGKNCGWRSDKAPESRLFLTGDFFTFYIIIIAVLIKNICPVLRKHQIVFFRSHRPEHLRKARSGASGQEQAAENYRKCKEKFIHYICSISFQKDTKNPPNRKCIGKMQSLSHDFPSIELFFCLITFQTIKPFPTVITTTAGIITAKKISNTQRTLHTSPKCQRCPLRRTASSPSDS